MLRKTRYPASILAVVLAAGCSASPPPKPDIVVLLKKLGRISDLSDPYAVTRAVEMGVTPQAVTQYTIDNKGEQKPDFVNYVTRAPVANLPGVTLTQYEVEFAGGTAVPAPAFDDRTTETRISFVSDPVVACVKLDDLTKNFGDDTRSSPVAGGWGISYEWPLRKGSHYSTSLSAIFGNDASRCATLVTIRQIRSD